MSRPTMSEDKEKIKLRKKIQKDTKEFLKRGGKIQYPKPGESGVVIKPPRKFKSGSSKKRKDIKST